MQPDSVLLRCCIENMAFVKHSGLGLSCWLSLTFSVGQSNITACYRADLQQQEERNTYSSSEVRYDFSVLIDRSVL